MYWTILLLLPCLLCPVSHASTSAEPCPGLVLEEVQTGSALDAAGVKPGDVLYKWRAADESFEQSWKRSGDLCRLWDWLALIIESAPRGTIILHGRSQERLQEWAVSSGSWKASLRPWLPESKERVYDRIVEQVDLLSARLIPLSVISRWSAAVGNENDWLRWRIAEMLTPERDLNLALRILQPAVSGQKDPLVKTLFMQRIAAIQLALNRYQEAQAILEESLRIREASLECGSLAVAETYHALGVLYSRVGDIERAVKVYEEAEQRYLTLANGSVNLALTQNNLAVVYRKQGNLRRAQQVLESSLDLRLRHEKESVELAKSLDMLGVIVSDAGNLNRGETLHLRAQAMLERIDPAGPAYIGSLVNLSAVKASMGRIDAAMELLQNALALLKTTTSGNWMTVHVLNNLGALHSQRGELRRAKDYYEEAYRLLTKRTIGGPMVARLLNNLGSIALDMKRYHEAQSYFEESLTIKRRIAPSSLGLALTLGNLAIVMRETGDLGKARQYHEAALEIQTELAPGSLDVALTLHGLGQVAADLDQVNEGVEFFSHSVDILRRVAPESEYLLLALHSLALAHVASNRQADLQRAGEYYLEAIAALDKQLLTLGGSYESRGDYRAKARRLFEDAIRTHVRLGQWDTAFHILERFRARTFLEQVVDRDSIFADMGELSAERESLLERLEATQVALARLGEKDAERLDTLTAELLRLRDSAADFEERVRRRAPSLGNVIYPKAVDVKRSLELLEEGSMLLSFFVGEESTFVFALSRRRGLIVEELPLTRPGLDSLISDFQRAIWTSGRLQAWSEQPFKRSARHLYDALLKPVDSFVAESDFLLVIPDGPLHRLAWSALLREEPNGSSAYLAELLPLHLTLSATTYAERRLPRVKQLGRELSLVAFGAPILEKDWEPLPGSRREVMEAAARYPDENREIFLGEQATEHNLRHLTGPVGTLHIATHGRIDGDNPMDSFLVLSPDQGEEQGMDGLLRAWEVAAYVRLDADLVILSGCETGLGEPQGGDGLLGLTRAFRYAGAAMVAASLWSVSDQATARFMALFHGYLSQGLSKSQALRLAQLDFIQKVEGVERLDTSHPYFWASFQLYGSEN